MCPRVCLPVKSSRITQCPPILQCRNTTSILAHQEGSPGPQARRILRVSVFRGTVWSGNNSPVLTRYSLLRGNYPATRFNAESILHDDLSTDRVTRFRDGATTEFCQVCGTLPRHNARQTKAPHGRYYVLRERSLMQWAEAPHGGY